jgi:hypothetical protein
MAEPLSAFQLELLPKALEFAKLHELTRDALRKHLSCGAENAMRLIHHIQEGNMVKVAARLERLPVNAETRAETQFTLGDTSGSAYSYVLRENSRLQRELSKYRHKTAADKEQRATEIRGEIEELKALVKEELGVRPSRKLKEVPEGDLMLEVCLYDEHWSKLCWPKETNDAPYDLELVEAIHNRALDTLLKRASVHKFERVMFCLGQDLLHSNGVNNSTAKGTVVDCDGRFFRTYGAARRVMIETIEKLRQIAPVDVLVVPGNHDRSIWQLADSIECWYHGQKDVKIDNAPTLRKYYSFGKCGWMITHGDLGKKSEYPLVFATEAPEIFSNSLWREIRCGHIHSTQVNEVRGVQIRTQPSLSPSDAWHHSEMYTKNMRNAYAYVFSKTEGLIAQYTYCDNMQVELKTERKIV